MPDQLTLRRTAESIFIETATVAIARYVFEPHSPKGEAPKPFLHPLKTLSGAPLSIHRPWDHRWHKGLQMTWSHVSGENFWGGPTFHIDEGYRWIDNLGSIRHESFSTFSEECGVDVSFEENLAWYTSRDQRWIDERRTHRFHSVDHERGLWALDFSTTLRNVGATSLVLGSPGTEGRPSAGYTGFFWRGPRSFTGGKIVASTGVQQDEIMGTEADWVAFVGQHDDIDGGATVLAFAGSVEPSVPIKWFVRSEPFACIAPAASFDKEVMLGPDDSLTLRHRHVFVDHMAPPEELAELGREFAL